MINIIQSTLKQEKKYRTVRSSALKTNGIGLAASCHMNVTRFPHSILIKTWGNMLASRPKLYADPKAYRSP